MKERKSDWKSPDNVVLDRGKERKISGPGFRVWGSEKHPLLNWVRRSCLELDSTQNKVENPIGIKWALDSPKRARVSLLQGIADGDGYVCVNSQQVGLSTRVNQSFFGKLLRSLDIESQETNKDVRIIRTESILKLAELQSFKHALSRRKALDELEELITARKSKVSSLRLSSEEIDYATLLRFRGNSYGEITRNVYKKFGNSWDISTIEHALKRRIKPSGK